MARTPKPTDSEPRGLHIRPENDAFLKERSAELRRNFTETFNSEMEFLRMWGLSKLSVPRLYAAAAAVHATPMQYVQNLVTAAALQAPVVPLPKVVPAKGDTNRTTLNVTGPNDAFILHTSGLEKTEYNATVNRLLDFCRTYGLTPNLHAALTAQATARDASLRDLVLTLISDTAARLPDVVPAPPVARKTRSK